MPTTKILIVDDDPKLRSLLARCFESDGFVTCEAGDAPTAMAELHRCNPDLITLDLSLGPDNGLDLARELQKKTTAPIVMVTGRDDLLDRVIGLELGADDYITKPFHVREVLARVRAILRRAGRQQSDPPKTDPPAPPAPARPHERVAAFAGWTVHPDRFEVMDPEGLPCPTTTAEFRLLLTFLEHPKRILSREQLMDLLGGMSWTPLDRTIDNQIARLRKKIERNSDSPELIKTVRGIGYSFTADVTWK